MITDREIKEGYKREYNEVMSKEKLKAFKEFMSAVYCKDCTSYIETRDRILTTWKRMGRILKKMLEN